MSILRNLSSNQRQWGLDLLNSGESLPLTVLGVEGAAVTASVVLKGWDGSFSPSLLIALGALRQIGADSFILAFDTSDPTFTDSHKRVLITVSDQGQARSWPLWEGGVEIQSGEAQEYQVVSELLERVKSFKASRKEDYLLKASRAGLHILNLKERFGQGA